MKLALDTNVLAYAEGLDGDSRRNATLQLLASLPDQTTVIPAQALCELFNVLVGKAGRTRAAARAAILSWRDAYQVVGTSPKVMIDAMDLATEHLIGICDAMMLAAAAEAGCRLLLSEDFQHGFTWRGLTVANPYAAELHPLLRIAPDQ